MSYNKELADKLGLDEQTRKAINQRHGVRKRIYRRMWSSPNPRAFLKTWTANEFILQALWGFPMDSNYHRFWEIPLCSCPYMDNEDRIGTGEAVYSMSCRLHGRDTNG